MTINFYLEGNKNITSEERAIRCFVREGGKTFPMPTGEKISPELWDTANQRADQKKTKDKIKKGQLANLNMYLNAFENKILEIFRHLRMKDFSYPFENICFEIKKQFNNEHDDFFSLYTRFINSKRGLIEEDTLQRHIKMKRYLEDFQKKEGRNITFEGINPVFFSEFYKFLIEVKDNQNNSAMKCMSAVKTFMIWINDNGFAYNKSYTSFKIRYEETEVIFITEEELKRLMEIKLTDERLERIRDAFVFQCHTGVRHSDLVKLGHEDIINGDTWRLVTKKGGQRLEIPLVDVSREILDKYKYLDKPLPIISNQKTNEYLKELCKQCEIDTQHKIVRKKGNKRIEKIFSKYELIGTHTARRTFVSLSIKYKIPPEIVMEITGHSTYKMMKKYLKITNEQKREEMNRAWSKGAKIINIAS